GVPEWLARRIEGRDTAFGKEKTHRTVHPVEPFADPFSDSLALLRRGPHQRHLRIVNVEPSPSVAFRNRIGRTEIDHIERAGRADIWHSATDNRTEAVFAGRKHTAYQIVADLRSREVDDAGQLPGVDQLLH